jgi:hypothetical protein
MLVKLAVYLSIFGAPYLVIAIFMPFCCEEDPPLLLLELSIQTKALRLQAFRKSVKHVKTKTLRISRCFLFSP